MIADRTVVAVVAMADNRVIGLNGEMPWHLPGDLKRFRLLTDGRPMIMGRKTLQSIGRLLPGRDTIVLTRGTLSGFEGAIVARGVEDAAGAALACAKRRGVGEIAVVGGAEIYAALLERTDRIELTRVAAEPAGDTFFPAFETAFRCTANDPAIRGERDSAGYRVQTWVRDLPNNGQAITSATSPGRSRA